MHTTHGNSDSAVNSRKACTTRNSQLVSGLDFGGLEVGLAFRAEYFRNIPRWLIQLYSTKPCFSHAKACRVLAGFPPPDRMKFNIASKHGLQHCWNTSWSASDPATGNQKLIDVDDERKTCALFLSSSSSISSSPPAVSSTTRKSRRRFPAMLSVTNGRVTSSVSLVATTNRGFPWNRAFFFLTESVSSYQRAIPVTALVGQANVVGSLFVDVSLAPILPSFPWLSSNRVTVRSPVWPIPYCPRGWVPRERQKYENSLIWARRMMFANMSLGARLRVRKRRMQNLIPRRTSYYVHFLDCLLTQS